ncbi:hypothetical protein FFF34_015525 [Inquilinus sp. KBS0705]|nr:hypothetical protein FFF34_015525 [Inquilinus sp. KBS0705]
MKNKFTYTALLLAATLFSNCKKGDDLSNKADFDQNNLSSLSVPSSGVAPNTVTTIAGKRYSGSQLVDGTGSAARFSTPFGFAIGKDGNFYVADINNNAVRRVTPQGVVSTVVLQPDKNGNRLLGPQYIGFTANGNMHLICENVDDANGYSKSWVYSPTGAAISSYWYYYGYFRCLANDPYEDVLWYADGDNIGKHKVINDEKIGSDFINYDHSILPPATELDRTYSAMFVGYNKVKYVALPNHLYKLTPNGTFQELYTDIKFTDITSIVVNKDSRTIYIADDGVIRKIENGKATKIIGPNAGYNDSRDGVGAKADAHAEYLLLGPGENVLYFTDAYANALRKVVLK